MPRLMLFLKQRLGRKKASVKFHLAIFLRYSEKASFVPDDKHKPYITPHC